MRFSLGTVTILSFVSFILSLAGCGTEPNGAASRGKVSSYTACSLPTSQGKGSLFGSWAALPVSLIFDQDFYLADGGESANAMRNAVNTWNAWGSLRGFQVFRIVNDGTGQLAGREIPSVTDCAQQTYTTNNTDSVGIWKIRPGGRGANRRDTCPATQGGKLLFDNGSSGVQGNTDWTTNGGRIVGASVLLNYDFFNIPGKQVMDTESVLLHELGHVLGLLHSCNGSSSTSSDITSAPNCGVVKSSEISFLQAVMFPYLANNQVRRDLRQNDYSRINCLY